MVILCYKSVTTTGVEENVFSDGALAATQVNGTVPPITLARPIRFAGAFPTSRRECTRERQH